mgnify:CR=1 FL=1
MDIIFNMLITKEEFTNADNLQHFVELVTIKFKRLVDIEETENVEIVFVERISARDFVILTKDKCKIDLEGKELLIFLIENSKQSKETIMT